MKITGISAHVMGVPGPGRHSPSRNWVFIRIDTDEHIIGVGEATNRIPWASLPAAQYVALYQSRRRNASRI